MELTPKPRDALITEYRIAWKMLAYGAVLLWASYVPSAAVVAAIVMFAFAAIFFLVATLTPIAK